MRGNKSPKARRTGEQLFLQVGDEARPNGEPKIMFVWSDNPDICRHYGYSTWAEALKQARDTATSLGLALRLRGRVRMNDYVGPPNWGEYVTYGEV